MAEFKDFIPHAKKLSILYIDENQQQLHSFTNILKKLFLRVDDASDATLGLGYAKLNEYDLIIMDSFSSVMNIYQLCKNLKSINSFQNIIITTDNLTCEQEIKMYQLGVNLIVNKPMNISAFLNDILNVLLKLTNDRDYLKEDLDKLNETLLYERKRIGRFMFNEKKLNDKIKLFEENIEVNKNTYELTKLPNKYALQNILNETKQSLLYINIDHFDLINTIYGMGKANKLLKECANRLGAYLPANATLFHITSDEFVIVMNNSVAEQDFILAKQIQALFKEAAVEFDDYSHYIVFSIGISRGEGKILFVNAKSASKESRYFGGNQITIYNPSSDYIKEQKKNFYWINVLNKAFVEDKIFTYYQPIVNNVTSEIKYYEVLCRLVDENNKLIEANEFISSARIAGLITQITRIVIDKTFKFFQENEHAFSINISMHDLHEEYLLEFLEYKCNLYNITRNRVHIEIVEDIIISKTLAIDKQILDLKESGFHVIVDDFTSDKSAYNRMFELKAEFIKIDGSFITKLDKDNSYKIIVQSIVDFAKKSNIKTIAEHVENIETYEIVKELGIDYSQGYFLGKPSIKL
ncbi:EAL domain-containing protein [bacterium]|nr:EAL domain-containing protein [bacterium]MBU1994293.1 EAL domain-containing protein [bacterium]